MPGFDECFQDELSNYSGQLLPDSVDSHRERRGLGESGTCRRSCQPPQAQQQQGHHPGELVFVGAGNFGVVDRNESMKERTLARHLESGTKRGFQKREVQEGRGAQGA